MNRRKLGAALVVVAALFVSAACGQKPDVANKIEGPISGIGIGGTGLPPGATVDEEGNIVDAEGNVIGNVEEGITDPDVLDQLASGGTGADGTTATGGDDAGDGSTGDDGESAPGPGAPGNEEPTGPGDTTGVTGDTITIGIHAPLSGAAPVPSDSVDKGKDLYFRWLERNGESILGRNVRVVLKNDQYQPSTAVAVCKEMVEKDKVFMLSGAAGTDQIVACARYAESVGVPYVGAGVTENPLAAYGTYFATSMSYPDQGPLLANYLKNKLGGAGEKNGMLFFDTASFNDAHDAFKAAASDVGVPVQYDRRVSKNASADVARSVVQEMKLAQIENVYVLTSPVFFIQVLKQANLQDFKPQWIGVGISMTFDTVLTASCPDGDSVDGAKFFSPFPAWVDRNKYDPEFNRAVAALESSKCGSAGCGDDFMWLSWSGTKVFAELLDRTGKDVTRERFMYTVANAKNVKNGIGPVLNFSPNDHFGADQVHVNQASCGDRRWHTIQAFASDF